MGKLILKTKKSGEFTVLYDDIDEPIIRAYKWRIGGCKNKGSILVFSVDDRTGKFVWLHKLIANPPAGYLVDHANMDRLDNRRCNLRIATRADNNRNVLKRRNNTSGYKGVWRDARNKNNPWIAELHIMGKKKHLGNYSTKEQAALAYNEGAKKYYGEFARLNEVK